MENLKFNYKVFYLHSFYLFYFIKNDGGDEEDEAAWIDTAPHIRTLVQEGCRNIQRVLWPLALPVTSQMVAIDPHHPFAPTRHISIRIGDDVAGCEVDSEGSAKKDRAMPAPRLRPAPRTVPMLSAVVVAVKR